MKQLFSFIFLLSLSFNLSITFASTSTHALETDSNEDLKKFYRSFQYAWSKDHWIFSDDFPQKPQLMDQKILKSILEVLKGHYDIRTIVEGEHLYRIFDRYKLKLSDIQQTYQISLSTDEEKTYDEEMGCIDNKITVFGNYWWYDINDGTDHKFSIIIFHTLLSQAFKLPVENRKKFTQGQIAHARRQVFRPPSTQVNGEDIGNTIYRKSAMKDISQAYTSPSKAATRDTSPSNPPSDQVQYREFHRNRAKSMAKFNIIYSQVKQAATQQPQAEDDVAEKSAEASKSGKESSSKLPGPAASKKKTSFRRAKTSALLPVQSPKEPDPASGRKVKELRANFEEDETDTATPSHPSTSSISTEKDKATRNPSPKKKEKEKESTPKTK